MRELKFFESLQEKQVEYKEESYSIDISCAYHVHMAGDHEKSFTYNRALARYASKIGDLDIAERSYKLANGQRLSELRDVIRQHGFVIDLDESRGDFTFIETTKI